jgi:predicted ArsR family transcriptional regulator
VTSNEHVHRALAGRSRVRTLEALRAQPDAMSVDEITDQVGLHPNTVRFHLQQLVRAGLATQQALPRAERGRPRMGYSATAATDASPDDAGIYRAMAEALAAQLEQDTPDPAAAATAAGRTWGRAVARRRQAIAEDSVMSRGVLTAVLDELGFDPHTQTAADDDASGPDVELHRCPLLDVARNHPEVTCGLHLGLMQGLLREIGDQVQATQLIPFSSPGVCVTRLTNRPLVPAAD